MIREKKRLLNFMAIWGLNLPDIARLAQVSHPTLYRWVNGQRDIYLNTWDKIRKAMERMEKGKNNVTGEEEAA